MNSIQPKAASQNNQITRNASGGEQTQKQILKSNDFEYNVFCENGEHKQFIDFEMAMKEMYRMNLETSKGSKVVRIDGQVMCFVSGDDFKQEVKAINFNGVSKND